MTTPIIYVRFEPTVGFTEAVLVIARSVEVVTVVERIVMLLPELTPDSLPVTVAVVVNVPGAVGLTTTVIVAVTPAAKLR